MFSLLSPFRRIFGSDPGSLENPSTDIATALSYEDGYSTSHAGVIVTPQKALTFSAVFAAIGLLSEDTGSLPLHVYRKEGRVRTELSKDPRWGLLNAEANPEQAADELRAMTMGHALTWDRGYQYIERNDFTGEPIGLWPLRPDRTRQARRPDGTRVYLTTLDTGEERELLERDVIVIRCFMDKSPLRLARQTVGLALAAEEFGARLFANDCRPGILILPRGETPPEQEEELRTNWTQRHRGLKKKHLVGVLTNADVKEIGIPPEDAQMLETRKFEVQEVARWFRVPVSLIEGDKGGSLMYSTTESDSLHYVKHSLRRWLVRYEKETTRKLFLDSERQGGVYTEFLIDSLLRGDIASRYAAYAIARKYGWMSANDIREKENESPIAGGDDYTPITGGSGAVDAQDEELAYLLSGSRNGNGNGSHAAELEASR